MKYPDFHYFVSNYFHQDWMVGSSSSKDVIEDFIKGESASMVRKLRLDVEALLGCADLSESLVYDFGGNYSPKLEGLNVCDWLESVRVCLVAGEQLKDSGKEGQ